MARMQHRGRDHGRGHRRRAGMKTCEGPPRPSVCAACPRLPVLALIAVLAVVLGVASPHALSAQNLDQHPEPAGQPDLGDGGADHRRPDGGTGPVGRVGGFADHGHRQPRHTFRGAAGDPGRRFAVGLVNAGGILRFGIHPILMTLSTMTAVQGLALLVRPIPGGTVPGWMKTYAGAEILGLPLPVICAADRGVLWRRCRHLAQPVRPASDGNRGVGRKAHCWAASTPGGSSSWPICCRRCLPAWAG
jgi:hypothetical protein